jgi:hypothetical protein
MSQRSSVPSQSKHRQSGQAIVTLTDALGATCFSGSSAPTLAAPPTHEASANVEARGRTLPVAPAKPRSVHEVFHAFAVHAQQHYRRPDGMPGPIIDSREPFLNNARNEGRRRACSRPPTRFSRSPRAPAFEGPARAMHLPQSESSHFCALSRRSIGVLFLN